MLGNFLLNPMNVKCKDLNLLCEVFFSDFREKTFSAESPFLPDPVDAPNIVSSLPRLFGPISAALPLYNPHSKGINFAQRFNPTRFIPMPLSKFSCSYAAGIKRYALGRPD